MISTIPKLHPFDDNNDDMDEFIRRMESYAVSPEWPKYSWAGESRAGYQSCHSEFADIHNGAKT